MVLAGVGMRDEQYSVPRSSGKGILGSVIVLMLLAGLGIIWAIEYVVRLLAPYWDLIDAAGR